MRQAISTIMLVLLGWAPPPGSLETRAYRSSDPPSVGIFSDVTRNAGIQWKHFSGQSDDRFLVETMGGGVAFFDFDNDGLLDLFFVNGGETPHGKSGSPVRNALYRNLGNGRFEDVAGKAGVNQMPFYGMGIAAADYDNDGFEDLFISGYPSSALFHNNGNGTFSNVTDSAGVANRGRWAACAVWLDYDSDSRLDLFLCNYVKFSYADEKKCDFLGRRGYCEQTAYTGDSPTLLHNNGDGTFRDVTSSSGLNAYAGRALGAVAVDANDDGLIDLFVARDASPNLLLINKGNGKFEDRALEAEVAYSLEGKARAGMGVDAADLNDDGQPDFVVTNFTDEYHALFLSNGRHAYNDRTRESGLAAQTRSLVGFGVHFLDYDNDGSLDLVIANGHVNEFMELIRADVQYAEPLLLLANVGGRFRDVRDLAGPAFQTPYVARGLAIGDFNNDGYVDLAFVRLGAEPVLLRNNSSGKSWIGFELRGNKSNRDAIGARLVLRDGDRKSVRWLTGGSSYLASHDKRMVFGLGKNLVGDLSVEIRWPSGVLQHLSHLTPNRYHRIDEPVLSSLAFAMH